MGDMSYWRPTKEEDISWNEDDQTIEIYSGSDHGGSRYVEIPLSLMINFLIKNDLIDE